MINLIKYEKLKKALLEDFKDSNVHIEIAGTIITRYIIENPKILVNKNKIYICNENLDCTILLDFIKKSKMIDHSRIELIGIENKYILEV